MLKILFLIGFLGTTLTDDILDTLRDRRQASCNQADVLTIENCISLIRTLETATSGWSFNRVANAVRELGYPGALFDALCRGDGDHMIPGLTTAQRELLKSMNEHRADDYGTETGVIRTPNGETIAFGHVMTGICSGLRRDFSFTNTALNTFVNDALDARGIPLRLRDWVGKFASAIYAIDNLHAATLAGDLGQTVINGNDLGPSGSWDDRDCPRQYNLTGTTTEATYAEILGDIHGFVLGLVVQQVPRTRLSDILDAYFLADGLGRTNKFKAANGIALYREAVSFKRLQHETDAFNAVYAKYKITFASFDSTIAAIVRTFYSLPFVASSCNGLHNTHTMDYFIDLIQEIELQSNNGLIAMAVDLFSFSEFSRAILQQNRISPSTDKKGNGFEWYIASESMAGKLYGDRIETGVYKDLNDEPVFVASALWGVVSGLHRINRAIDLTIRAIRNRRFVVGVKGEWGTSCRKSYTAGSSHVLTYASLIGMLDGIIFARTIRQYRQDNPTAKLSDLLRDYYSSNGLSGQANVKSSSRVTLFISIADGSFNGGRNKRDTSGQPRGQCLPELVPDIIDACKKQIQDDDKDTYDVKEDECDQVANNYACAIDQVLAGKTNAEVTCKYGDIMKLKPTGASAATGKPYGAGVAASGKLIEGHMSRIDKYKECFVKAGQQNGIHPALIAALASRESLVYSSAVINTITGYSKNYPTNKGYGMMQCDPASGLKCTKYGPDSCEHVAMMIKELFVPYIKQVAKKHPKWSAEQHLQGAVAAYNFGVDDVQTWQRLDIGTTKNDYSNDIVARAQWLVTNKGWNYCSARGNTNSKKLPNSGTLLKNYPTDQVQEGYLKRTDRELRGLLGSSSSSAIPTDALRIGYMLNRIPGQALDSRIIGATAGEDGNLYYREARQIRQYLEERYGVPTTASSASSFAGKPGILFVKYDGSNNGIIGLWNGKKTWGSSDFTNKGSQLSLWETGNDCKKLAEDGDCEYYIQCVEQRLNCGPDGYAVGYGYNFCNLFSKFYADFNDKGKQWVDSVRPCLMKALYPVLRHPGLTCAKLTEVAFKSHVPCYDNNDFCLNIVGSTGNWDAVWEVFTADLKPLFGPNWDLSWGQILAMAGRCTKVTDLAGKIGDIFAKGEKKIKEWLPSIFPQVDEEAECVQRAQNGDCAFYECFEKRYNCKQENGFSYLLQFELPNCLDFQRNLFNFESTGRTWINNYHKCLMDKLLPMYKSGSVNCALIGLKVMQSRMDCIKDSGVCSMIKDKNDWFLDRVTTEHGYPFLLKRRPFAHPISGSPDDTDTFFYRQLVNFKYDMGHSRQSCGNQQNLYEIRYSPVTKKNMKLKTN